MTIKGIPDDIGAALRAAAARSNRSLNGEILHRLRLSLEGNEAPVVPARLNESPDSVADAWEALAGRWKSDLSVEAEIASLYEARSGGRDVDVSW